MENYLVERRNDYDNEMEVIGGHRRYQYTI